MEKDPLKDGYDHAEYNVSGTPLVHQEESRLYTKSDEYLSAVTDMMCDGYYWAMVQSLNNDTSVEDELDATFTTELKITKGKEEEANWSLGAAFEGITIGIGGSKKTFSSSETTDSEEISIKLPVPPRTTVYLYQKVYRFKTHKWFINYAWDTRNLVGGRGNYHETYVDGFVEIHSKDYASSETELTGVGNTTAKFTGDEIHSQGPRKFENCTEKCKNYLKDLGAHIPSS
ncbi:uncharacterized protein N7500_007237 [Penicillium coprophilum]|uniref:uncharacterized protein n=1 Tax=Penicillium coprophilum TaxID=36646 RepID=UPI0023A4450B|nr:uncharacterized protein N7500_007237 [Penicillium coprophilum]KAJ5165407.1 hypothetical protein N7500_007237 [Penicillium coprophilum]